MISMSDTIGNRTLMNPIPTIIDFEASSLASASYPIEVAWNLGETIEQHLIAPIGRWTDWSVKSEALHGISRDDLIAHGESPSRVCERLNQQLAGRVVYSDNPDYDAHWLEELFAASYGQTPQFQIGDFNALIDGLFAALPLAVQQTAWHDFGQRLAVLNAGWIGRHRAGRDVAYLLSVHRAVVEVVEAFGSAPTPPPPGCRTVQR
jgi:hypothetical protein